MIFDLEVTGHHAGYIRHLLRYWPDADSRLMLVVSPKFMVQHNDVVQAETRAKVTWCPISEEELAWYEASKRSLLRYTWAEWRLFCRYAKKLSVDQGLVMYVDRFQLPLALRLPLPCPLSGIYFRPKFHYGEFANHRPAKGEEARARREQWLWRSALGHPKMKALFSLDPFAVEPMNRLAGSNKVVYLPDPIEYSPPSADDADALRHQLGVEAERKIFLLFGSIDQRKGLYQVLSAIEELSKAEQRAMAILCVGRVYDHERERLNRGIQRAEDKSEAQVLLHDEYVPEEEVPLYFALADVVLALYRQHVGSSGILLWAAAAGKPVLASDYGLMGALVRRHHLGEIVDSRERNLIVSKIKKLLNDDNVSEFKSDQALQFARGNSAKRFTEVLWQRLKV